MDDFIDESARYYPSPQEEVILIAGLHQYLAQPERSANRNKISKQTYVYLICYSSNWSHRSVRLLFNNNKNKYILNYNNNINILQIIPNKIPDNSNISSNDIGYPLSNNYLNKCSSVSIISPSSSLIIQSNIQQRMASSSPITQSSSQTIQYIRKLISISKQTIFTDNDERDQISIACESLQTYRQKKDNAEVYSKILPSNNIQIVRKQFSDLNNQIKHLQKEIAKYKAIMDKISKHIGSENGILYELFQLHLNEKSINYSDLLKKMCIQIHEKSRKSYEILHENIPLLPPTKEIEDYFRTSAEQFSTSVSDLDKMKSIVAEFKQQYKINNTTKVYAMLAVDALFSNKDFDIFKNGEATGMLESCQVDQKTFTLFSRDINSFINLIKDNWNEIIKVGFVFQLNPLNSSYQLIVIHIIPSANGKANQTIIDKLYEIKKKLHNYRIEILSFAFDGNNAFKGLLLSMLYR